MTRDVTFCTLSQETLDAVSHMEQATGDVCWTRAHFEKELSLPMSRFFVLRAGSNILGYGGYWNVEEEAQITNLAIHPQERRQGFGSLLLEHLLTQARTEGCRAVTLEVRNRNQAAQALYHKAGFIQKGRRPKVYTNPEDDALLMEKVL